MPDTKKAGGDAPPPPKPKGKAGKEVAPEIEEIPKTPSQTAREEAEYRAMMRKQRFKRKWPEISKVKIKTRKWNPPQPPQKQPQIFIELPEIKTRQWVPPYRRRRRRRPKLRRIPLEELTQPLYECASLKKVWHNFCQVEKNKMILQGTHGCNSKKYSSTTCGSQTGSIALVCRALLEEKTPAQLVKRDVDDVIEAGDRFYKQCMLAMKCYKGKPQLQLNQLLTYFFFHDTKYTVKMVETDKGVLLKDPDNIQGQADLMTLMEKRIGGTFMTILTVSDRHFLIWGHPPAPESGSSVRTVCYIFDPHILNEYGQPHKVFGAGAFIRYAGVNSFVVDFLANYGNLNLPRRGVPKLSIALTDIEVVQKERLIREPTWELDLKALKIHCRSEWDQMNVNALREKKLKEGQYPLCSLSGVSLASSRATSRRKVKELYQKGPTPKEAPPQLPIAPEKAPPGPTTDQIMQSRGENFFLYCPATDGHNYGRDDMIPYAKSETILHSPVEIADKNFHSQFSQLDVEKWILRGTRHMASYRYQTFKTYTSIACCVAALGMLRRLRARAWNEDTLDETLDLGYNYFRESLAERGGPIRRLVLGELKETFKIRDREYKQKLRGIAVWGKLISNSPKVFDLCRGIESFFKEADTGVLQIPGEYETAIWNEGGKFHVYHPWPADRYGYKIGLRDGGKACLLTFGRISRLCEHFMENVRDLKKKPFSVSDVKVLEIENMPEPVNKLKPVAPNRWLVRGRFHEGDERFPEEHRNKQATPTAITAIAMAHIIDPSTWTPDDIDQTLVRGDILYQSTMEHLEKMGISVDTPPAEEDAGEEEMPTPKGTLAAADVLNRFKISEYDCIETDILDNAFTGQLNPESGSGVSSLTQSLGNLFKEYTHAVVTARGGSTAIWRSENHLYFFDPQGCDENGLPSNEPRAASCLVRVKGSVGELAKVIEGNLPSGADDSFYISPVEVTASKLNADLGAPETKLDSKAFQWISKGTAAIMMGPRGENTALGKLAEKVGVGEDDMAGRVFALPAAAAFTAATDTVPPPHMHQDHMYNFLDAGAEYYLNHLKKTNRKDIQPEDLKEKFEMGANTFSIELGEPIKLPLRLPDEASGEGAEEGEKEMGEAEEEGEPPMKQIKDLLFKMWNDQTKPTTVSLLVGDYHQMGVWMAAGGKVVAFDPAPTLMKGLLTPQRIKKGDELRLQRIRDEMAGEGGGDEPEEAGEEAGAEGEEKPEPEPEFVPPESCPALMVFASPKEFIDKLVMQGGLDIKQSLAPYKLYLVTVINELTSVVKEKKGTTPKSGEDGAEAEEEALVEPLEDAAIGKYFMRLGRTVASVRARVAQNDNFFMDTPNRDNQDAANSILGIVVDHIEPYVHWRPPLLDAILKYGDRLYTLSLPRASARPKLSPREVAQEFHVTSFNVKLDFGGEAVNGDIKAGPSGGVLSLKRGIAKFFESNKYGVICAKGYCVGIWRGADDKSYCLWEPHAVGPTGRSSPGGAAALVLYSTIDELAGTLLSNIEGLARPGTNKFSITPVKVFWEISKSVAQVAAQGQVPDEGYEWKVLTAYVEVARGRTILRGSRPPDVFKFTRDAILQSACGAIVSVCMTHVRRPPLWTKKTVDEVMNVSTQLFAASIGSLGYEFRPGEDVLLPLQVLKRFVLGVNYVRYDMDLAFSGKLEQIQPTEMSLRAALVRFFESNTHGILWSMPHAVAVWRVAGSPSYYMFEPHACGPTGLRIDAEDDGAACVLTFSSPKLMAFSYLQNISPADRTRREFYLYSMSVNVRPIHKLGKVDPPLVRAPPGVVVMPATSKVTVAGAPRRADEADRKHPPGSATCLDAQRASEAKDKEQTRLSGQRNTSGWLSLIDRTQYLSAAHSMACKKFPHGSRGNQAVPCAVMAVAMSRVEEVCRWCSSTLNQILESGDQLYQDSYLHFKPASKILNMQQVLRKFFTPGDCVCRVVVYQPRHKGVVDADLQQQLSDFFREEKTGVLVAGAGHFAVALFKTTRGYYMWDPADRDRYARAVAPPCVGRARACLSRYPNVNSLCEKLGANIPPAVLEPTEDDTKSKPSEKVDNESEKPAAKEDTNKVRFEESATFVIYGMEVTSLRKINKHEV